MSQRAQAVLAVIERRLARERNGTALPQWSLRTLEQHKAILERHTPQNDGPLSLVSWTFCSCGAMESRVAEDGYNSPRPWPCPDVQGVLDCYPGATP